MKIQSVKGLEFLFAGWVANLISKTNCFLLSRSMKNTLIYLHAGCTPKTYHYFYLTQKYLFKSCLGPESTAIIMQ